MCIRDRLEATIAEQTELASAWKAVLAQQTAEDIVVNGLKVATASPAVAQAAAEAHNAYQAKKDALDKAAGELDAARAAYEEASERAGVTEQELAEKLADLAMAQPTTAWPSRWAGTSPLPMATRAPAS